MERPPVNPSVMRPMDVCAITSVLATDDGVPLHERVKRRLSEAILLGQWAPGATLPGETYLAEAFGVAVGTVRRALSSLVSEGLILRRPKVGTVVTGRSPHHSLRFFFQYFRLHGRDGSLLRSVTRNLTLAEDVATAEEALPLRIAVGDALLRFERLRLIDGTPIMRDRITLPAARLPGFARRPEDVPSLLYVYLLESYGIRIAAVREEIRAELADERDCALLGVTPPAAVLVIDEVSYDQAGNPALLGSHRAVTTDHRYVNEVR
jgi:GntR family transcriptional regulator